jgi:hypothetical protein
MDAAEVYDALADTFLSRPGVAVGRSLNNETLTVGGKIFAFLKDGALVVKVPATTVAALLAVGDGVAFMAGGRTMREWAMVPDPQRWSGLMEEAFTFVGR